MSDTALTNGTDDPLLAAIGARGTRSADYPSIAAEKGRAALDRVAAVHERFGGELREIGRQVADQAGLASAAIEHCGGIGPSLESMGAAVGAVGESTHRAGLLVRRGREELEAAVADVQELIGRLRERNQDMRGILEIGRQVTEGVDRIAETAVENKLIAINAAITASKASDRVKGFKVIANEISKISAAMAERVQTVVQQSVQVGSRMQGIMATMEESILSTQKALGNIDQAFALLQGMGDAISSAESANAGMLAGNRELQERERTIGQAMRAIAGGVAETRRLADEVEATMGRQSDNIRSIVEQLPDLDATTGTIAAAASQPESLKILRMAESALTEYDPARTRMLREIHLTGYVCIRLLRYSSDARIVPYLADAWLLDPDGRTWEFTLKKGVRFHDGSPVTARDVKFSFERVMHPAIGSPYANLFAIIEGADDFIAGRAGHVSGIVVRDDYAVSFRLKSSFNYFLSLLALGYSAIVKEDPSRFSVPLGRDEIVSAGPFRLLPDAGDGVDRLAANGNFVNGRPFIDGIEIRRTPVDAGAALADGSLDIAYNMTAARGRELAERGFDGSSLSYTSRYCYGLIVNYKRDNFLTRNPELRRALCMAMDKAGIIQAGLGGHGLPAESVLSPEALDTGGRSFLPYDPAGARRIFDSYRAKGEDLGRPVSIVLRDYPALPGLRAIERGIKDSFAALGLEAVTVIRPLSDALASFGDDYDLIFAGFLPELDLYSALEPFVNPAGGDNYFGYDNPRIFRLLEDSIAVKDGAERNARFVEILEQLTMDVFMVPLFFQKVLCTSAKRVRSVFMGPEETIIPDALYLVPGSEECQDALDDGLANGYSGTVRRLGERVAALVELSRALIGSGKSLGAAIAGQRAGIAEANRLFEDFMRSAGEAGRARDGMLERIRGTAGEAAKGSTAARLIGAGLDELGSAIGDTRKSLEQVRRDIKAMQGIMKTVADSNGFLGSVAINAAIIAAKSDRGDGDLRKVSESIAGQTARNVEYTNLITATLERMEEAAAGHHAALGDIADRLAAAAGLVDDGGRVLEGVGPLLDAAGVRGLEVGRGSRELAATLERARGAVGEINDRAERLAVQVDTLKFGLDLEAAVVDIAKDVAWINKDIRDFTCG